MTVRFLMNVIVFYIIVIIAWFIAGPLGRTLQFTSSTRRKSQSKEINNRETIENMHSNSIREKFVFFFFFFFFFFWSAPPPLFDIIFFRISCDIMYILFTNLQSIMNNKIIHACMHVCLLNTHTHTHGKLRLYRAILTSCALCIVSTKQQTKTLRPKPTKINSFMSGPSSSLTPDPPACN